jgi:hypothetical protein
MWVSADVGGTEWVIAHLGVAVLGAVLGAVRHEPTHARACGRVHAVVYVSVTEGWMVTVASVLWASSSAQESA